MAVTLDVRAEAEREHRALLKSGKELGKLVLNQATSSEIDVEIAGFINFRQLDAIVQAATLAGSGLERVNVRINSTGGSAFAGVAIANYLASLDAKVTTTVESSAMSAAAVIFMAGDERLMGPMGSTLMFHPASGWIDVLEFGNRARLEAVDVAAIKQQQLDVLDALDEIILGTMTDGTKLDAKAAGELMQAEKQIGKDKAVEYGLATGIAKKTSGSEEEDSAGPAATGKPESEEYDRAADEEVMAAAYAILNGEEA